MMREPPRFRLRASIGVYALAAYLFALIALAPLRAALDLFEYDRLGLSARGATGSVWRGILEDARIGPVALGDVQTRLGILPLLAGQARLRLSSETFEGVVIRTRGGFAFDSLSGRLALGPWVTLDANRLGGRFGAEGCRDVSGGATAVLAGDLGRFGFPPALVGEARCDRGAFLLPLVSSDGRARLDIRVGSGGRYRMDLAIRQPDPVRIPGLVAAGFRPAGSGYRREIHGEF